MPIPYCALPLRFVNKDDHALLFAGVTTWSSRIALVIAIFFVCTSVASALYSSESLQMSTGHAVSITSKIASLAAYTSLQSVFPCVMALVAMFSLWLWFCGGIKIQTQSEAIASRRVVASWWVAGCIALVYRAACSLWWDASKLAVAYPGALPSPLAHTSVPLASHRLPAASRPRSACPFVPCIHQVHE